MNIRWLSVLKKVNQDKFDLKYKNLLNNQNYIINSVYKAKYKMKFYLKNLDLIFPLNILAYIILYVDDRKKHFYFTDKNRNFVIGIIYTKLLFLTLLLSIGSLYLFLYIWFYSVFLYLLISFYFNFKIIDTINDFFETKVYITWFKKRRQIFYDFYSYRDNIYTKFILSDNVLLNNWLNIHKLFITIINLFFLWGLLSILFTIK